jgi:ankyrin repeat protein/DNA-binding Xre family transcriptional regulator
MNIRLMSYRFLWVEFQIAEICYACEDDGTADRILDLLHRLPTKLEDIYRAAFQRVCDDEKFEIARKVFQWVMYARRRMTPKELEDAVSVSIDQKFWKEPSVKFRLSNLSRICRNLVSYDEMDGVIYLAHHSILQFLQSCTDLPLINNFYIQPSSAEKYLGKICVTYLMFGDFEKSLTTTTDTRGLRAVNQPANLAAVALTGHHEGTLDSLIRVGNSLANRGRSPGCRAEFDAEQGLRTIMAATNRQQLSCFQLLDYCISNWYHHCSYFTTDDIELFSAFRQLVVRKDPPLPWLPWDHCNNSESFPHWDMFEWAVRHGNPAILNIWRECVSDNIAASSWERLCTDTGEQLFSAACAVADIVQLNILIQNCVETVVFDNATNHFVFCALYYASAFGYCEVVDRIIGTKPNVGFAPPKFRISSALAAAAAGGHKSVVELLIQQKADVNTGPTEWLDRTALQAAAEGGHLAVVERLVQEKADINAGSPFDSGRTALQAAAQGGHLAVVERLIQEKADVNADPCKVSGRTALQAAAEGGHLAVVEKLIQEKADINADPCNISGRTALQAAAQGGHLAVVERLIQEKANINAKPSDSSGRTTLQAAAQGGHLAVVERLIQEKADINAGPCNESEGTALQAAAQGGHLAIVERLIQEKADVNATPATWYGKTALQAAAEGGHLAVVERLIQEKADINAKPGRWYGKTALQAAAEGGHLAVVERLIQEKADINAKPGRWYGKTALQAAAEGGHLAVVERLIRKRPISMLNLADGMVRLPCRLQLKVAIWPLSND